MTLKRKPTIPLRWAVSLLDRRNRNWLPALTEPQANPLSPLTRDDGEHAPAWPRHPADVGQTDHATPAPELVTPRADRGSEPDLATHSALATEFRSFAEQDLQYLARVICNRLGRAGSLHVAQWTAELCRLLCADIPPGRDIAADIAARAFDSDNVAQLAARARRRLDTLRQRGANAGGVIEFDFATVTGTPMTEFQQPWSLCDPDALVTFVVIPAYTVNHRHLSQQVVYTRR